MPFFWLRLSALVFYWGVLTRALLVSNPWTVVSKTVSENPPFDTSRFSFFLHFSAYLTLALLIALTVFPNKKHWRGILLLAVVHGGLTEILQNFVPGRIPSFVDFGVDCLGLIFGTSLFLWLKQAAKLPELVRKPLFGTP